MDKGLQLSGLQNVLVPQRSLQRRLHLHLPEFLDGEIKVFKGFGFFVWIVVEKEFSKKTVSQN